MEIPIQRVIQHSLGVGSLVMTLHPNASQLLSIKFITMPQDVKEPSTKLIAAANVIMLKHLNSVIHTSTAAPKTDRHNFRTPLGLTAG